MEVREGGLVLSRNVGETIEIGPIQITIHKVTGKLAFIRVNAPKEMKIDRSEGQACHEAIMAQIQDDLAGRHVPSTAAAQRRGFPESPMIPEHVGRWTGYPIRQIPTYFLYYYIEHMNPAEETAQAIACELKHRQGEDGNGNKE